MLREYAQGAAQAATQPVADFLAPTVPVATAVGRFKKYTEQDRFRIPNTKRSVGGRATEIGFTAVDAEAAALGHEFNVVNLALTTLGAGTNLTWSGALDPVSDLDGQILAIIKAAKYGSLMGVGVLFGATAWKLFKNNTNVRGRFIVGANVPSGGYSIAVPTEESAMGLLIGAPAIRVSYMVYDTAAEGLAASINFILDSTVLVFARLASPTRRDPSFMKTFRLNGQFMVPGSYMREDNRVEVAKFDWSEDIQVTNSAAAVRLNIS